VFLFLFFENFYYFLKMLKSETFIFSKGFSFYMIGVYRREDFHQSKLKKI